MNRSFYHCRRRWLLFLALASTIGHAVDAFVSPSLNGCVTFASRSHILSLSSSASKTASSTAEETATPAITERFLALTQNHDIAIIIDMENVRGKTSFEMGHADLLDRLAVWTSLRHHAAGRTIVVVDHGSRSSAHLLRGNRGNGREGGAALCVAFAGPHVKADDVIARDVTWLINSPDLVTRHVVVITADQELAWRCRAAARSYNDNDTKPNSVLRGFINDGVNVRGGGGSAKRLRRKGSRKSRAGRRRQYMQQREDQSADEVNTTNCMADDANASSMTTVSDTSEVQNSTTPTVEVITPQRFLEDLDLVLHEWLQQQETYTCKEWDVDTPMPIDNIPIPTPVTTLQKLFRLRGQILTIETSLRKKCSLRKRQMMTGELRKCKEEWEALLSSMDENDGAADDSRKSLASSLAWSLSSTISSCEDNDDITMPLLSPLPPSAASAPPTSWEQLSAREQEKLLLQWGKRRGRHGTRREKTEDRIVLAERLRRQLELIFDSNGNSNEKLGDAEEEEALLVNLYADYINSMSH